MRGLQAQLAQLQTHLQDKEVQSAHREAQMQAIFDQKIAEMTAVADESGGHRIGKDEATLFDNKHFRMCKVFEGTSAGVKWEEWLFDLLRTVSSRSAECANELQELLREAGSTTDVTLLRVEPHLKKHGPQLFSVLCVLTTGEANLIVRSTIDKGVGHCGFTALCLLSRRYNPKTPARVLQHLIAVLNPPAVKDVRLLERTIEEWEAKRYRLKSEFQEEFSDNVSIAILTSMLSRDLQDMVYQQGKLGEKLTYKEVRDKVMSVASHRAEQATPTPMEVGRIGGESELDESWQADGAEEIDAIAKNKCYACEGWGHLARDCPTRAAKGKGKMKGHGFKGGGKLGGKGAVANFAGKGWPSKGAGKGYGYQGICYNCGVVGHKAAECTRTPQSVQEVVQGDVGQQQEACAVASQLGGVWSINAVTRVAKDSEAPDNGATDASGGWRVVQGRWRKKEQPWSASTCARNPLKVTPGRYGVLGVQETEDDVLWVCPAEEEEFAVSAMSAEITVDSAADESVCPRSWAEQFGLKPVEPGKELKLVNASGGKIQHWGSRRVQVHAVGVRRPLDIGFQVTDVKKPLLSVRRLCENGNVVQFGRDSSTSFVRNVTTGEKIPLERRGKSWVIPSTFVEQRHF